MNTIVADIDQLVEKYSESDLKIALGELVKKILAMTGGTKVVPIQDSNDRTLGFFLPDEAIKNPDLRDYPTFLAVTRYRIANPPAKYLTPEEFIAALSSDEK